MQRAAKFVEGELLTSESGFKDYNDVSSGEETAESEGDEDEEGSEKDGADDDGEDETKAKENGHKKTTQPPAQVAGKNRMRSRFLICEKEFDVTENQREACAWHPGKSAFSGLVSRE